ncbi:MAG: enoyl-CoA hydratase/isomerase family protein [Trueperaceae bacterium]|nr:enoyl-CoA hydratase/isomerase family protein [Trueperaceae bacterium]
MNLVLREDQGQVRLLTLNRPEVRNALNQALQEELQKQFDETKNDAKIRVVVLTGVGKAFCSGLDLAELEFMSQRSTEENRDDSERLAKLFETIYSFPKPVIAALNGHAIAGGAGLASVCDYVFMAGSAKLGYTESRIGFVAALVSVFLLRQLAERDARDLLLSGRLIPAKEAQAMRLVTDVVPDEHVLARALEQANSLIKNSPGSLAMTKKLVAAVPAMGLKEGLSYATELNALARTTNDLKEGISAFLQKREPDWG